MTDHFTGSDVTAAARRTARALIAHTDRFNALDAHGGDGDMGTTLATVSRGVLADDEDGPDDVGAAFLRIAKIIAGTSGSSLSAVVMTGLMDLARTWAGTSAVPWGDMPAALAHAVETMRARSKARPGDKTILDGLERIGKELRGATSSDEMGAAAQKASAGALEDYRDRPATIGRLRLAPSRGVGVDDPGMVALDVAMAAIAGASTPPHGA